MNVLPTYHLPPGAPLPETGDAPDPPERGDGSPSLGAPRLEGEASGRLLRLLRDAARSLRGRPVRELVELAGRVAARFGEERDPLREEALRLVPGDAGLSPPMAEEVVRGMARDWEAGRLRTLLEADFPDPEVLDGFRPGPRGDLVRAVGDGLAFHVGAGSVPGLGATSLIRSLLVKSPVLLKPGRGDVAFSVLAARALSEEDPEVGRAVAVVYWPGGRGGVLEERALEEADRVVVYGGNASVRSLRDRLPPTTPLIVYPHRFSAGAVAREALDGPERGRALAGEAARAVAVFDQRGCVSPHVVWVEEGGALDPGAWAEMLAEALEELNARLPPGPADPGTAARVHQLRGAAELRAAAGSGDRVLAGPGTTWTVLLEPDPTPAASCLGRTVRVKPLVELERLPALLAPLSRSLQTMAVEASPARRRALAEALAVAGVTRITTFRRQPWPPPWWRHDGAGPLSSLVRWIGLEGD